LLRITEDARKIGESGFTKVVPYLSPIFYSLPTLRGESRGEGRTAGAIKNERAKV